MRMKLSIIRLVFSLFIIPLALENSQAGDSLRYYQEKADVREFNDSQLNHYRELQDFQYSHESPRTQNGVVAFIRKVLRYLLSLISSTADSPIGSWLFYLIGAGCLLYLIIRMLGMDLSQIMGRPMASTGTYQISNVENIHELNFRELIESSVGKGEYRAAVRLWYLYSLKMLSDRQFIRWEPAKTNDDYLSELKDSSLISQFKNLSFYFKYIWYGNFRVSKSLFTRVQSLFQEFTSNL